MNSKRYYTVGEANQAIAQIEPMVRSVTRRADVLNGMRARESGASPRPACDTRVDPTYFQELEILSRELRDLNQRGCEVKDLRGGVVDFPAQLNGREVCLCWRLGESAISHWHEVDAGFKGRQPIAAAHEFEEQSPGEN
jgi:hypothetical protein